MVKNFLILVFLLVLSSCNQKKYQIDIDGVAFWKMGETGDSSFTVRTIYSNEDSVLLLKSISILELTDYKSVIFERAADKRVYAKFTMINDSSGYDYSKLESSPVIEHDRKPIASSSNILYDGTKCAIISEDFVKSKMNFPKETKIKTSGHVHEVENGKAVILNKFTTKNAFGVEIEYVYKIWMSFTGGEWEDIENWSYSRLIIENTATGEQYEF